MVGPEGFAEDELLDFAGRRLRELFDDLDCIGRLVVKVLDVHKLILIFDKWYYLEVLWTFYL